MRKVDTLIGHRYAYLVVRSAVDSETVEVECDCGTIKTVKYVNLRRGFTRSCGCLRKKLNSASKIDRVGQKFGRLTVVSAAPSDKSGNTLWSCECDCGTKNLIYQGGALSRGAIKSCGCLRRVLTRSRKISHGESKTVRWNLLVSAKRRAKDSNLPFDLELDDIPEIPELCPLLGIPLRRGNGSVCHNSPSLDKIIPSLGYVKGNIQIVSHRANSIKSDASFEEFEAMYLAWKAQRDSAQ